MKQRSDGIFTADVDGKELLARTILLATGVVDVEPDLPDIGDAIQKGLVHHCGICEGYESRDKRLGVIGHASNGLHEALFLRNYATDITLLSFGCPLMLSDDERRLAQAAGTVIIEETVTSVVIEGGKIRSLDMHQGTCRPFDAIYAALGSKARSNVVRDLGTRFESQRLCGGRCASAKLNRRSFRGRRCCAESRSNKRRYGRSCDDCEMSE